MAPSNDSIQKPLRVLSLFDGMSCGQLALRRAGVRYESYHASEVDKFAIRVTQHNFPETIQVGDVGLLDPADFQGIDLLLGGSPCQGFSFAGGQLNFEDERSKLFFEYERLLKAIKPRWFLLENVAMKKESEQVITERLGVEPVAINSALFSAQNRVRLYWTNIPIAPLPEKNETQLKNILRGDFLPTKLILSEREKAYMDRKVKGGRTHWDFALHHDSAHEKSHCLVANLHKGVPYNVLIDRRFGFPVYRKFDPVEVERLQTVPVGYTSVVSNTQRYKMLGNGWTVDVVAHILSWLRNW